MSAKQWLGELAEAGISMLRGLTFPSAIKAPDDNPLGLVMVFAALAGGLYAMTINGFHDANISPLELSGLTVLSIGGLTALFWLVSKIFLKVTKSTKTLIINLVESCIVIWTILLSIVFLIGLNDGSPFRDALSYDGLQRHIVFAQVCLILAIAANFIFWCLRLAVRLLDNEYFDSNAISRKRVWWTFLFTQIFTSFTACYFLLALPYSTNWLMT